MQGRLAWQTAGLLTLFNILLGSQLFSSALVSLMAAGSDAVSRCMCLSLSQIGCQVRHNALQNISDSMSVLSDASAEGKGT